MRTEQSTAARSLRAVALVITLVTIVTFSTIAYSAYADVNGVIGTASGRAPGALGSVQARVNGNTETVEVDFAVPNAGFYPLRLEIACAPPPGLEVSCQSVDATVAPGQTQLVTLVVDVANLTQFRSAVASGGAFHLQANLSVSLEPFATLEVRFDLGSALTGGGA